MSVGTSAENFAGVFFMQQEITRNSLLHKKAHSFSFPRGVPWNGTGVLHPQKF